MHPIASQLRTILDEAGALALQHFRRVVPDRKADGSEVTAADRAVEALLVDRLHRAFPDDGITSEEGSHLDGTSGAVWHVDPIDGTSSFVEGLAHWGPTVVRATPERLDVGAFWQPRLREFWFAGHGHGAWRDGERLPPPPERAPTRSGAMCVPSRFHRAGPLPWPGKVRALGSSAAHLALVAAGSADLALIPEWSLWDVGCGALLVTETGRVVTDLDGQPVDVATCRRGLPILAGAPTAIRPLVRDWADLRRPHLERP